MAMIEATSCGGVVIYRGKILLLYKNYRNRYEGWVLPKGTVESDEEYKDTAIREVKEETGASATIIQYVGKSHYSFTVPHDTVEKDVHWYLMMGESYYSKPQREEYFTDFFSLSKYNFHIYDSNKNELGYTKEEIMSLYYEFNVYNALTGEILFNISKQPDMVDSYKIVKKQDSDISMKDIIFLTCIIDAIEDSIDDEE